MSPLPAPTFSGIACLALLALTLTTTASPQDAAATAESLESIEARFHQQRELLAEPISKLNDLYEGQLSALRDRVKEAGNLDHLLIVDQELRGFRDPDYEPEASFPEIDRLRGIYRNELAKRQQTFAEALPTFLGTYVEQLQALSRELTRQDKVEEALAVREVVNKALELLAEARAGVVAVPAPSSAQAVAGATVPSGALAGRMGGIGFGKRPAPLGQSPRGISDVVSIEYWERDTFDSGWVALRANGSLMTDQERRVSSTRDRIVAYDCGAAGILMVRDDGSVDASLCTFAPPDGMAPQLVGIVDIALGRHERQSLDKEVAVAVKDDGTLLWWGPGASDAGVAGPPPEARRDVAKVLSGRGVYSVLKKDGSLVSWKFEPGDGRVSLPPEVAGERFRQVVMSEQHSLGLTVKGKVLAWGQNREGQTNVPVDLGECTEVRVIHNVASLARRIDGTWAAWGRDYGGIRDALNGASGRTHIVGRLFPPGEKAYALWIEEPE